MSPLQIIECPRDAMQGIERFIATEDKIRYINQLLKVGFDTIDAGSFVSAKAIPQMRDSAEVFDKIDYHNIKTSLLAIVANTRGAEEACRHQAIKYLGFPLSMSETFQIRNTNKKIPEALNALNEIQEVCKKNGKTLVTYISMGFGNPYGDPYDIDLVVKFVDILATLEVEVVSLADTIGVATTDQIKYLFTELRRNFPGIQLGAHLHSQPITAKDKIVAALHSGCRRFDGAIHGLGGCPMAEDKLVGNLATETIIEVLNENKIEHSINPDEFWKAGQIASEIF